MTTDELKAAGAELYMVEGPNSDGVVGYFLLNNQLYYFRSDFYQEFVEPPQDPRVFIRYSLKDTRTRYRELAEKLRQLYPID